MAARTTRSLPSWTTLAPGVAILTLVLAWGRDLGTLPVILVAAVLGAAVLAAVHHAEVVAHRVGEPFGSLVLAVAVTIIEVGAHRHADGHRRQGHRRRSPATPSSRP